MKLVLANTKIKIDKLLNRLDSWEDSIGFDTEVVAPLLRGRDFIDITRSSLLGLSIAFEDEEAYYMPIRHKGSNASFMQLHSVCQRLQTHAKAGRVWAHNAKFDHQVMIREGYPMVGMLDSMVAAWLVLGRNTGIGLKGLALSLVGRQSPEYDPSIAYKTGAETLEYACHDALNALQLGIYFRQQMDDKLRNWFLEECAFTMILAKMKLQGMRIDRDALRRIREEGDQELTRLGAEWDAECPFISITSSTQLQELFEEGTWQEHSRTTSGKYSTSKEAMQYNVDHGTERGRRLAQLRLDYQEVAKVVSTYTDALIEESLQWADKRLHPDLHHFGTVTGRLSSSHPNIQNQPAHGEWAKKIKQCFIPDPGMEFTSADYSQVELRYFANYCGGNLLQAFVEGKDLHAVTAGILGVDRQLGKTINFGFLLYGGGPRKLGALLDVSPADAEALLERLQEGYPEIEAWRTRVIDSVSARGPVPWCKTLAGRRREIPELDPAGWERRDPEAYWSAVNGMRKKYGRLSDGRARTAIFSRGKRLCVNYLVQGGSRDLLVIGMNRYEKDAPKGFSIVTTVHDEVLTQHPRGEGQLARDYLKHCLESAGEQLGLRVPIVAEPKTGSDWYSVK
jgi:DNA polymerase-1